MSLTHSIKQFDSLGAFAKKLSRFLALLLRPVHFLFQFVI